MAPLKAQFDKIPAGDVKARFEFVATAINPHNPAVPSDWRGAWLQVQDFMSNEEFNASDTAMLAKTGPWAV